MMKRRTRLQVIFILVGIMLSMTVCRVFAAQTDAFQTDGGVQAYFVQYHVFREFIEAPSRELLEQASTGVTAHVFSRMESSHDYFDGYVQEQFISAASGQVTTRNGEALRFGNRPVYASLVDFAGDRESLANFLAENGVTGEITDVVMIGIQSGATTIYLKVNQVDYFITVDEHFDDYATRSDPGAYVYRLYSYAEYYDKFGLKDGKLFVNGVDITQGNDVKIHRSSAYLPFRAVMESLGAKVEWDARNNTVLLTCGKEQYVLDVHKATLVRVGEEKDLLILPPGGIDFYCNIVDNRIVMSAGTMLIVSRLLGADIRVDYDNLIVNIDNVE